MMAAQNQKFINKNRELIMREYYKRRESVDQVSRKETQGKGKVKDYFQEIEKTMFPRTSQPSPQSARIGTRQVNGQIKHTAYKNYEILAAGVEKGEQKTIVEKENKAGNRSKKSIKKVKSTVSLNHPSPLMSSRTQAAIYHKKEFEVMKSKANHPRKFSSISSLSSNGPQEETVAQFRQKIVGILRCGRNNGPPTIK